MTRIVFLIAVPVAILAVIVGAIVVIAASSKKNR